MALTIDLTPTEEARLRDRAAQEGLEPETLASKIIREEIAPLMSAEEELNAIPRVIDEHGVFHQDRLEQLEAFMRRRFGNLPQIPAEALTREALYQDHD